MSITELKKTADGLSAKERRWLRAYLFSSDRAASKAWQNEMAQKRRRLKAGAGVSDVTYKRQAVVPA